MPRKQREIVRRKKRDQSEVTSSLVSGAVDSGYTSWSTVGFGLVSPLPFSRLYFKRSAASAISNKSLIMSLNRSRDQRILLQMRLRMSGSAYSEDVPLAADRAM